MTKYQQQIKLVNVTTVPQTLNFLAGQTTYMKSRGFEVHALSSPGESLVKFADRQQITVHAVTMHRSITPLKDIYALFQIWQKLCEIRPQIVQAHTPKGGLLATIAAWLARVPVRIYYIHGLPMVTATGYKHFLLWWSEKVSCLLANQVFCVSHSVSEVAVSENICPIHKIKVLLRGTIDGIDATDSFNPANLPTNIRQKLRQKYDIPDDALVVGFVGRIVRDKGIAELIEAWKILREEFSHLHLLIVGPFEPQDPVAPDEEYFLRNESRIHLTGNQENIAPFYAAMNILALPTYREGFGNVNLEAAAMELPVVTTRIPGCIDAVQDGVTGILVPPRNPEALADAIRTYLHDSELRDCHGRAGRERVLRDFRPEAMWQALYQEYLRLFKLRGLSLPNLKNNTQ